MSTFRAAGLAVAIAMTAAAEARADDPCAADIQAFCAKVEPGAGQILKCLEGHAPTLSSSCRASLEANSQKVKGYIEEFFEACHADSARFCPTVEPGGGRIVRCLSVHDYELSRKCEAEVAKLVTAQERVAKVRNACQVDAQRLCRNAMDQTDSMTACLKENEAALSPDCRAANPSVALEAASIVETLDEMTSESRIGDAIQIIQGLNSVAFSRNQIGFTFDYYQKLANKPANVDVLTFVSLLVFGAQNEFAVQVKVPVAALFPTQAGIEAGIPTVSGIASVNTAFGWAFYAHGAIRQYAAVALQWNSASEPLVGAPWVIAPIYVFAVAFNNWLSLTVEADYLKSFGGSHDYPGLSLLQLSPNVVFSLPAQLFISLDAKFGWDFVKSPIFVPVMRFQAGKLLGEDRTVSVAVWYQFSMNEVGQRYSFDFGAGASLAYFFNW